MGHEALPDDAALARQYLQHSLGESCLQGQRADTQRAQRGELGRLEDHGVAGGQGGGEAPAGDGHREIPRDDDAHHAQGLVERQVDATGNGDLEPAVALGRGSVVLEHVAHVARLPAGIPDDVAGVRHLQQGQLLAGASTAAAKRRSKRARSPGATCRHVSKAVAARAMAASTSGSLERGDPGDLLPRRGIADKGGPLASFSTL